MHIDTSSQIHPGILNIQGLLQKVDRLHLPPSSRRDVESILVRQASKEIDRALPWLAGHGRRTAAIALMIGQASGLSPLELHHLKLAAFLHDIGLITLPIAVLRRSTLLDARTHAEVQQHPRIGAMLLEPFRFLREASVLIAHHHERWDGCGYPYGVRGPMIPLGSRILAIADAFDAMEIPDVTSRQQRNMIAFRILQVAAGTQFDPDLVASLGVLLGVATPRTAAHSGSYT